MGREKTASDTDKGQLRNVKEWPPSIPAPLRCVRDCSLLGNCSNPGMTNTWHVYYHLLSLLSQQTLLIDHDSLSPLEPGHGLIGFLHSSLLCICELKPFYLEGLKPFVSKQMGILMREEFPGKNKITVFQSWLYRLDVGAESGGKAPPQESRALPPSRLHLGKVPRL